MDRYAQNQENQSTKVNSIVALYLATSKGIPTDQKLQLHIYTIHQKITYCLISTRNYSYGVRNQLKDSLNRIYKILHHFMKIFYHQRISKGSIIGILINSYKNG